MSTITVNGQTIPCGERQMILQACLDAGIDIPVYCYHPGLSIVASCRICLVEVEGIPKLVPACNTPIRPGMVVYTESTRAVANRKAVMEYLLTSHPLDCPVCDQSGECYLQDYSFNHGRAESRFEEDKERQAKKDVGENILLYSDRCIYCTRCVRFTREVSGSCELYVKGRSATQEIDAFPGYPINNKLAGNVVDICPVGALLDKDFLFKQRVWLLKSAPSISPADSGGENIYLDHNMGVVYRIRPRYNHEVNKWWISDDTRYTYKVMYHPRRLLRAKRRQYGVPKEVNLYESIQAADATLREVVRKSGQRSLYAMLSPTMSCEEAWLLARYVRQLDPQAILVMGPVPRAADDDVFRHYLTGQETFRIQAEKVPNSAGIRRVMQLLGGPTATFEEFAAGSREDLVQRGAGWVVGGYLSDWISTEVLALFKKGPVVVQDILPNAVTEIAEICLPMAAWSENEGCWENYQSKIQAFLAAVAPPDGVMRGGDIYYRLLGRSGMYNAEVIRREMGEPLASVRATSEPEAPPALEFQDM